MSGDISTEARVCSIEGCDDRHEARGWCNAHYHRWRRTGHPLPPIKGEDTPSGFLKSIAFTESDECIEWPFGKRNTGYGAVVWEGVCTSAHRISWELRNGRKMRAGMHAAHAPLICHNRACVNPRHIREATPAENISDRIIDGTNFRGHRKGVSTLNAEKVMAIRQDDRSSRKIAADYGIGETTVRAIKSRKTWKHV